jgi:hypothetical protein
MNPEEYREYYLSSIKNTSLSENIHPIDAFINDVADMMINDFSSLNELSPCNYEFKSTGRSYKSMKIDAFSVDVVSNVVNLLIADYNDEEIQTITNEKKNNLSQLMLNFYENVLNGFFKVTEQSAMHTQAAFEILRNIEVIDKIHLYIISTNRISERVKDLLLPTFNHQGRVFKVKLDVIDFDRIYKTRAESFEKDDVVIETEHYGVKGIPCIKAQLGTKAYDSYLAVLEGGFLADIYDDYSSQLLESNVRSFLSFRGAINKGIRGTILNARDKFFTFNNGISATAKDVEFKYVENEGFLITKLVGFQIINGGQTTASLASTRIKEKASLDNIYVQMKLTVVKEDDPDFIRNIAKFANSQNKVTSADLNSNHPFYTRIEDFSRKIYAPALNGNPYQELWFFERARGQYEQPMIKMTTKKQRDDYQKIRPKDKKFTKTDLAKFVNSANMQPHYVSWGADVNSTRFQEQLEKNWEKDNSIYNEYFYKELIGMAILYKSLERIISKQEWYVENKAYRPQLVTYTFAKFVYEIKKNNLNIDYKQIWDKQSISTPIENELVKISKLSFENIYGQREISNIGTYCKSKLCWERLQEMPCTLSKEIADYLISEKNREIDMVRAKKDQRNDTSLDFAVEIFKRGEPYWQSVIQKATEQRVINYIQSELLEAARKSCTNGRLVTNKQAAAIFKILQELKSVGIE